MGMKDEGSRGRGHSLANKQCLPDPLQPLLCFALGQWFSDDQAAVCKGRIGQNGSWSRFWLGREEDNFGIKGIMSRGQSPTLPNQDGRDEEETGSQEEGEPFHKVQGGWVERVKDARSHQHGQGIDAGHSREEGTCEEINITQ